MTRSLHELTAPRPCVAVTARAYELLDGELEPAVARAVRDHLRACVRCRTVVEREQRLLALVARAARIETAPAALVARVHAELAAADRRRGAGASGAARRERLLLPRAP